MLVIRGIIRLKANRPFARARGMVRLEDVSFADLPSTTVVEQPIGVEEGEGCIAFALPVAAEIDRGRRYIVSVELATPAAPGAPAQSFGVTAAHGWDPASPHRPVEIELEPLN